MAGSEAMTDDDEVERIRRRLRDEYYDRKVKRAEEILPYLVGLFLFALGVWVGATVWDAITQLMS